jgi:undecaprenyl-diphosphatase
MTLIQSIILGIVQGLTEFLPISSSAHLVLVPYWLGWNLPVDQNFIFDVIVQLGTLAAVIIYFWKDLVEVIVSFVRCLIKGKPFAETPAKLGWFIILATIPAGLAGISIKKYVEAAFNSPMLTALLLLVTAVLLIIGEWLGKRSRSLESLTWLDALIIGCFQVISIFPGVSRSGSTITGGLLRQLDRKSAARFSFLMSIPIMLAAGLLEIKDLGTVAGLSSFLPVLIIGTVTAGIVGYFSIKWLLNYLNRHSLFSFSIYCIGVWLVTFIITLVRG